MSKKYIVAIDLGGTNLKAALFNQRFKIIGKSISNTRNFAGQDRLISAIISSLNSLIRENNIDKTMILGFGVGLPGPIDIKRGMVHFFPNIPGWKNVKLKSILQRKTGFKCFLDNDANLMCLAEYRLGAARGSRNVLCITLGTGVGGGIILNGTIYRGSSFAAGEIGHLPINENGPKCNCGGKGCLETYVGNQRIIKIAERIFKKKYSLEKLSMLAAKGHRGAFKFWKEVGGHLGRGLVGVVNLLNPDCIVIGGGIADAGKPLFDEVRRVVNSDAMKVQARHVKILKAKLGYHAGLIGAAILVKENFLVPGLIQSKSTTTNASDNK